MRKPRLGLDPGTLGLKGHRFHYSLFIRFREPHIHRVLRSVRSVRSVRFVAIEKC
jgi:CO dehydrogenase/acetyl-CoA synthase epsilon subunit